MARFRGAGTGANRGWWVMQPRDAKKRWIEEFGVGAYSIGSDRFTGQVVGFNSSDSIDVERRTKNGSPTEATVDTIDPSTIEMMDVKALLDKAPGLTDEQMAKARNSSNNRPKAGSYPTGTVFTSDSGKYTKEGNNSWSDGDGNSLNNKQMDERLDSDESSSAEVPEDAELTSDNILEAVDGSSLSWNNKQYSRLDGKWFDEKTGKPVSDKTMAKKTDGDLSTEGGKDSFTPTPASEYPTDTKLHAEMNDGESTADLHKTDDNEWKVQTEESTADADDATADKVIEAADTIDMDEFLLNPTESEPVERSIDSPGVLEKEVNDLYKEWQDLDVPKYEEDEEGETQIPLTDEERAELERIQTDLRAVADSTDKLEDPEDIKYAEGIKDDAERAIDDIDGLLRSDSETSEAEKTDTPEEPARADVETSTDEPVDERVEALRSEIDNTDDKASLEDIERELADLDNQLKDSQNNDDVIARERIAEAREANNSRYAELEAQEDETEALPQSGDDIDWEEEDASAFDQEVQYYEDAVTNGYRTQVTKEKRSGERARWRTEVYDNAGDLVGESDSSTQKKARDEAARMVREDAESESTSDRDQDQDVTPESSEDSTETETETETETSDPAPETEPEAEAEAEAETRTTDDIITDLDTTGSAAIDAISEGTDDDLDQARTNLLDTYQEAQRAIDSPDTSNEDKVRLQSKVEEVDRAVTAIDQEIERRNTPESEETGWFESESGEGVSDSEALLLDDGGELYTFRDDDDGKYYASAFAPGSDDDLMPTQGYDTREEAREAAQNHYDAHNPSEGTTPETISDEDLEGGYQADPEPNDDTLSTPTEEDTIRETQEAAENGTLDVESVDPSADFTPTEDNEIRRTNAEILANPQDGDTLVTASGRRSEYVGGQWVPADDSPTTLSNEAVKEINKGTSETILVGRAGTDETVPPKGAKYNRHGVELSGANAPDHLQITNEDGTQETYSRYKGRWHRRLDSEGNFSKQPTDNSMLHAKLNESRQVATKKNGAPVSYYGEKELAPQEESPTPEPSATEGGGLASPEAKHVPATSTKKPALGSNITNRPAKTEPNKVLMQDGKRVGMSDSEGNTYFVGDRVIYTDRSNNVRSARITAVSERGKDKKPAFDMVLDEHDPETPEDRISFDEWYSMSGKERVAAGLPKTKYSKTKSMYQDSLSGNMRHASDEGRDEVLQEHQTAKEQGLVTGTNVTEPEILNDVSSDRVVRDESTAIIGTTNKYGELFQRGEVVEYGPNGEVGTIVHIGEADDRIRIAPNGQSALESEYYHVDTISHSNKPATYYDKNYDLDAQDRVARDRFNNELRVGDTVYRYGYPFTVKDIYPDGRKIRVVGQDWAGEQGSKGSLSTSQLIDLGFDEDAALELGGKREHDFMPDHLQVFTGDAEDIKSIRTHDSHMMTVTRDSQGRVLDTQENRDALASRALGTKSNTKMTNSAIARYIAENGDSERYERDGIKPGDSIDSGIDQAAGDNLQQYVQLTFGTDMVIPDNSRMLGYNKFGQYETYTKKDNRWYIDGVEGDDGMSAQEFYQYRLNNGYIPNPDGDGDPDQFRMRLSYLGDADDHVVPKPGSRIKKTDDEKFALMPVGSIVRFTDAEGNIITIRKGPDGQWYKVTQSGAFSGRKPVQPKDVPGAATYRGHANNNVPLPKTLDTTSDEAKRQGVEREARQVQRNNKRREQGGVDRIYGTHITAEDTFREGVANTETVRDNRLANERLAAERDELARQNEESARANEALREALRQAGIDPDAIDGGDAVTASMGNRIIATRKGTDQVIAVYNRVSDNVWEHVSAKGYRREFVLEAMPSTPGVTYKVEEHVA